MNCHECGHPINHHDANGCWHEKFTLLDCMDCKQTPETIAAYAVQVAVSDARKVIEGIAEMSKWSTVELAFLRGKAAAWLAAQAVVKSTSTQIEDTCQHTGGRSAEGGKLRCVDCGQKYEARNEAERQQVAMYGNGQSLKGYQKVEKYERDLNTYHDGEYRS